MLKAFALILAIVVVCLISAPDSVFGGGCYPNQVAFGSAVVYRPVAAFPLTTVPYAIDSQSYMYHVNSQMFQTWSNEMQSKYNAEKIQQQQQSASPQQSAGAVTLNEATVDAIAQKLYGIMKEKGVVQDDEQESPEGSLSAALEANTRAIVVLEQKCMSCHREGLKTAGKLAIFKEDGSLAEPLPLEKILARMNSQDPAKRMPPGKAPQLSEKEHLDLSDWLSKP